MRTKVLGLPRIGKKRELKKALESYWKGNTTIDEVVAVGATIRKENWQLLRKQEIDYIPSNDFSFYDQVLDMSLTLGCIPKRYEALKENHFDLYFAMARGAQREGIDVTAMEMTKWFNTNYHYIVPEFYKDQTFSWFSEKVLDEYNEAKSLGIDTTPVLLGPVSFLLLGKEKEEGFHRISLLDRLLPIYQQIITGLLYSGATHIQFDEPCLALDLQPEEKKAITQTYFLLAEKFPQLKIVLASYFGAYLDNLPTVTSLPIHVLHLDLCASDELDRVLDSNLKSDVILSLGVVEGRNIWKNNYEKSIERINKAIEKLGEERVWISTSCSLLHTPYDLDLEEDHKKLPEAVLPWLAFAKQKVGELYDLKSIYSKTEDTSVKTKLIENVRVFNDKEVSEWIHNKAVKERVARLTVGDSERKSIFKKRQELQRTELQLPLFPTTTIGSFPQTKEVRSWRSKYKKGLASEALYKDFIKEEIEESIRFQEEIGLDVLVHGEFERNDMVEYFGEQLEGFAFTNFGWVQSYGTRCVKPPIIYGDVFRPTAMTVDWTNFAQSLTTKLVKGMLTGPVTILQWSFVRNDQPRELTTKQIALAIRDEVSDLEDNGIKVIQIDEPAFREGLPLREKDWKKYLEKAAEVFRISASTVADETQIHTHMCYSEFNNIIESIAEMDADVITIETSRSEMELLEAFSDFKYPNEIGPGVYDIHSPRIPSVLEMKSLIEKAGTLIPNENLWINPDCGLKTRDWPETKAALKKLVSVAKELRQEVLV